jgi:soluble lytic murein transglycosylase
MKTKQKLILVTIGVMAVMSCFTYATLNGSFPLTNNRAMDAKEAVIGKIAEYMKEEDATIAEDKLRSVARMIYEESEGYNVDYRLILAIVKIESNFKHNAVSSKGARGLLQVKPSLAKFIARDIGMQWGGPKTLDEPEKNIKIGVHLFSGLVENFDNITMALHAYHVGPTKLKTILSEKRKPDKSFINLVLTEYKRNKNLLPDPYQ